MAFQIARLDHVQLAAPEGCERAARHFYGTLLRFTELEKPPLLRARGGCWFACGGQQVHIGVERDFRAAKKAHLAFAVSGLDELRAVLIAQGVAVIDDHETIPGTRRFYADDPFGNRLEFFEERG